MSDSREKKWTKYINDMPKLSRDQSMYYHVVQNVFIVFWEKVWENWVITCYVNRYTELRRTHAVQGSAIEKWQNQNRIF